MISKLGPRRRHRAKIKHRGHGECAIIVIRTMLSCNNGLAGFPTDDSGHSRSPDDTSDDTLDDEKGRDEVTEPYVHVLVSRGETAEEC